MSESLPAKLDDAPLLTAQSVCWILYEVGYLAFAGVIFSRYLASWIITDLHNPDVYFSIAQFCIAATLVVAMPLAGAMADFFGRRAPLLAIFSLGAASVFALVGSLDITPATPIVPVLTLVGFGAIMIALAFAQYDPMLPTVAPEKHWGLISGLAVGCGVLGAGASVILIGRNFAQFDKSGSFAPAALILTIATIPLLLVAREPKAEHAGGFFRTASESLRHARHRFAQLPATFRQHPKVGRLVAARFMYTDAIGTVNVYLIIYLDYLGTFSETQVNILVALAFLSIGIGGVISGVLIPRIGPRLPLLTVLPTWSLAIMAMALTGSTWSIWTAAFVGGVALGTVWTADRVFMLLLTPAALRGELFGVFALIGRVAQAIAPLILWGALNWLLHDGTGFVSDLTAARVSLALLALTAIAGALVLRPLSDSHSEPAVAYEPDLKTV